MYIADGALPTESIRELICIRPLSHRAEWSLELGQAQTEIAANNWSPLLHVSLHSWRRRYSNKWHSYCANTQQGSGAGSHTGKQHLSARSRTKLQVSFGTANTFSTSTHFLEVDLVCPDAHTFCLVYQHCKNREAVASSEHQPGEALI